MDIGDLARYAIKFAKALSAEVWAILRSRTKEADAKQMSVDGFLATNEEGGNEQHRMTFYLIINMASPFDGFHLSELLSLLDVYERFNTIGRPSSNGLEVHTFDFITHDCFIGASNLGS